VPEAFIAIEDRRFRTHRGIDLPRVAGALWANFKSRRLDEGSSTITMQLARNVFPGELPYRERTLARKLLEARVAQRIEDEFDKDQILEMYLNHIYFGSGAYGIQAAAHQHFGVSAENLTLAQAALLAALPKSPARYDPRRHPEQARERRDLVLSLMADQQRVSSEQADQARREPVRVSKPGPPPALAAPYFVEAVRVALEEVVGDDLYTRPLRVFTTLDVDAQTAAEEELERQLRAIETSKLGKFSGPTLATAGSSQGEEKTRYLQGALVAIEASTGDVLAWVGGRDFRDSPFDRVRSSVRQAGSAFKPFVYATALESGYTLIRPLSDEPLRFVLDDDKTWEPKNVDNSYDGTVTLRDALVRSKNLPTVRLATEIGYHNVAVFARRAGFRPPIPEEPALALGTVSVSPLELTVAYTAFANLGSVVKPRLVSRVESVDGSLVWQAPAPRLQRVVSSATAYMITDVLREALVRGTGSTARAGFSGPAAGKTGTTNDGADAWFVGYTPDVVATVWMGFDEVQPILGSATGGRLAAPIWGKVMRRLYRQRNVPKAWAAPSDVVDVQIDEVTGFALSFDCIAPQETTRREIFRRGATPMTACRVTGGEATPEPAVWRPVSGVQAEPADPVDDGAEEPARSYPPKAESSSDP